MVSIENFERLKERVDRTESLIALVIKGLRELEDKQEQHSQDPEAHKV